MSSYVIYRGSNALYSLKIPWSTGTKIPLSRLYKKFGHLCPNTDKFDLEFVDWLQDKYLSRDFELVLDEADFIKKEAAPTSVASPVTPEVEEVIIEALQEDVEDLVKEAIEVAHKENNVTVVESTAEVASTEEEALESLKSMSKAAHSKDRGSVQPAEKMRTQSPTKLDKIKEMGGPEKRVMTGDDLADNLTANFADRPSALVMSDQNRVKKTVPTSNEEKAMINAKMSEVSNRVKVLNSDNIRNDDRPESRVIVGGDGESRETAAKEKSTIDTSTKVNKNFKAFNDINATRRVVTVDCIVNAESDKESQRIIGMCKEKNVLKAAKIYLKGQGRHKLISDIERRLRNLR